MLSEENRAESLAVAGEFIKANETLVRLIRKALDESSAKPSKEHESQARTWQTRVLQTLESDLAQARKAAEEYQRGKPEAMLYAAGDKTSLSKDLDGFSLEWATPENNKLIRGAIAEVVHFALELRARISGTKR